VGIQKGRFLEKFITRERVNRLTILEMQSIADRDASKLYRFEGISVVGIFVRHICSN
jgi:hypothetical protein